MDFLFVFAITFVLYTFPDGKFVPRWTAWVSGPVAFFILVDLSWPGILPEAVGAGLLLMLMGVGLFTQVYRYRRVSSPTERQQTKWVLAGLAGFLSSIALWVLFVEGAMESGAPGIPVVAVYLPVATVLLLSLPISLGISILRYRLWDIDLLIRRTLVYSALTALLALAYFGSIVVLQSLFRAVTGQGQSEFVTVLSTLGIAALFFPLRRRVQEWIDRRFYRKKYDAAKTLAAFSASVRDETDLDKLTERLVQVVDETMQPAHVSLWLKPMVSFGKKDREI
jgi:hypothetical protein